MTSHALHGTVINCNQIKTLPSRDSFLDPAVHAEVSDDIGHNRDILFMPNDLQEMQLQERKYEKAMYKIALYGALLDGRRAIVVISGIKPYFEVVIPPNDDHDESGVALTIYNELKRNKDTSPESFEILKGRQFKGYQKTRKTFARFYFNVLKTRKDAIKFIRGRGYDTTADDLNNYFRVVCRDYLTTFSSWVTLSKYTIREYPNSIRGPVYDVNIKNYARCMDDITTNTKLAKDNILSMCWDIETYAPDGRIPMPENPNHRMFMIGLTFQWYHSNTQLLRVCLVDHPCKPRPDHLTIVCGTEKNMIKAFGKMVHRMKPDLNVGFNDADYDWPWLVNRSKSYPGMLTFLAGCFDSNINWKGYTDENIASYNFKGEAVKIEATDNASGRTLVFPGYINIDVRTIFRQLYPTAEQSNLNFFLGLNKLGGKKDMPIPEMFDIYRRMSELMERRASASNNVNDDQVEYETLTNAMGDIADYCVIDSQRCHELLKIRSVIMDRREIANLSYTSVFDAFYRANGMKVRNLVIARGQQSDIKFSNISNEHIEEGKYPGAYVFPPKKGLVVSKMTIKERIIEAGVNPKYSEWLGVDGDELASYYEIIESYGAELPPAQILLINTDRTAVGKSPLKQCFVDFLIEVIGRPITGLDFSSLYPSIVMAYNLSPEYMITDQKIARDAQADGHALHKIKFMFNERWVRGWCIRHDNNIDPKKSDYKFGVYPMILNELFEARTAMKKNLHKWESEKERIETLPREQFQQLDVQTEYETVCFNFNYLDSKQRALKVFMNTFYGEAGSSRSPFFVLQLAGGITDIGKQSIKLVQKYVEDAGCSVYYGDTDSIYSAMPICVFADVDKKYYTDKITKEEYWTDMVNTTFREIAILNKKVNEMLIEHSGTRFLKMAFEESLFPVAFLAKKKYYGIPHTSIPNFYPKNLFIRGLEVKKRGVSEILRKVCMNIMWDSVSVANRSTLLELVQRKIDCIYETKWDFEDFVMTDRFNPTKQNVKVHTFVARMLADGIKVKPNERFKYVITKKNPFKYDERGRKHDLSIGDKMEFSDRASGKNMDIDIDYYMKGSINGQLARLVTYVDEFHVSPISEDDVDMKASDAKTYNNACKYIDKYCEKYYTNYQSKGKIYQKIFRISNAIVQAKVEEHCGAETASILGSAYDLYNLETWLEGKAEKEAIKGLKKYGCNHVLARISGLLDKEKTKKLIELQHMYFSRKPMNLSIMREKAFKDRQALLQSQIRDNMNRLTNILNHHTKMVGGVQDAIKNALNIDSMYNESSAVVPDFTDIPAACDINTDYLDAAASKAMNQLVDNADLLASLNRLRYIYINMVSNYDFIHRTRSIVEYLMTCRNKSIGMAVAPKTFNHKKHIADAVNDIILEMRNG